MKIEKANFFVRSKIWIVDSQGEVIFGLGRYRILYAAAKELRMSYRAVWMRIRLSEKRMGKELIVRNGNGSHLTPFAENMMKQYRRLQSLVKTETDEVYKSLM